MVLTHALVTYIAVSTAEIHKIKGTITKSEPSSIYYELYLISNFRRVLNFVCFLLDDSPASEVYMLTFRNILFHLHTSF
jgi:hypothetical protein